MREGREAHERGLKPHGNVIYLDDAELFRLTGYKRAADQIAWLERNGVPFTVNARRQPVVRKDMDKTATTTPELGPVR